MTKTPLVAVSAGGTSDELSSYGIGVEHIEELMVRLTMQLLSDGCRVAYGGTMGVTGHHLTENLIRATESWHSESLAQGIDVNNVSTWPLANYSAWPYYLNITKDARAKLIGICHFIDVDPLDITRSTLTELRMEDTKDPKKPGLSPTSRLNAARALTQMRNVASKDTDLRIVWEVRSKVRQVGYREF